MSYIEFFGTIFNIASVWLIARHKILNRPAGLIGTILYIFLFYQIQLYADLIEQLYFFITGLYGRRVRANTGEQKDDHKTISYMTDVQRIYTIIRLTLGTIALSYVTSHLHIRLSDYFTQAASFVALDAFTTVLSFIATMLLVRKKIEARYLRILVDIIGIWLYYMKGVQFIAAEYILFLILATS